MAVRAQYLAYLLEQLDNVSALRSRRMFSGVGLYSGDLFFGLVHDDTLFFKTDGSNSADYIAREMPKFMPFPDRPKAVMSYYQVPADVIEDAETLIAWARRSVAVALTAQAAKAPKTGLEPRKKVAAKAKSKPRPKANAKKKSPTRRAKKR
jgi:DNA transformation protein and related proteins